MKYVCEICGCAMSDLKRMSEHEKQCKESHTALLNCVGEINGLIGTADAVPFGLVVESFDEDKPVYYPVKAAELDGKGNRCIIKTSELQIKTAEKTAVKGKK